MIKADGNGIVNTQKKLVRSMLKTKSTWDAETLTEIKKCISALSTLSIALGAIDNDIREQLDKLGFSDNEIYAATFWDFTDFVTLTPDHFFKLVRDGLDFGPIPFGIGQQVPKLEVYWIKYHSAMMQDRIMTALERYEFSRGFLKSWTLSITITVNIMTLLVSIFTIFGITETAFHYSSVTLWIYISLLGFLISTFLLALSLRKMFVLGIEN